MSKAGFVSIIGRPNVGKSTLLNLLVGAKIAGVSSKPQTTRGVIRGILTTPQGQVLYLDTPGFHKPADMLGDWMLREVEKALEGADLVYWMVIPGHSAGLEQKISDLLKRSGLPVFLVVNQVDRFPKPEVLPTIVDYQKLVDFKEFIPISAKDGTQVDLLVQKTFEYLPEGQPLFPEDQISDQNERFLVCELIREKIYHCTDHEIPYDTALVIEQFVEREDGIIEIHATFAVQRDTQKAILIGKNGQKMKEIGQAAREEIEKFLGKKVFLKLWVKTEEHWKKDPGAMKRLGYQ